MDRPRRTPKLRPDGHIERRVDRPRRTPKLRPDGHIERRVLLPKAIAARADELGGSPSIEAFSVLINRLVEERVQYISN